MDMQSIISFEKVKALIPQKKPFDMVDGLLAYFDNEVKTNFQIREDNLFVENGCFNASGMLENIAQSIALHTSYGYFLRKEKAPIGYIGSISNVKVFNLPKLNSTIKTHVKIIQEFMGVTLIEGEVFCNDKLCLQTKMKTFIASNSE